MSRLLTDLLPKVQDLANEFLATCASRNFGVKIYLTYRTNEEQDALYAQGRTTPGKIVTNAKGGESYHCYGMAFDAAPLNEDLTINWTDNGLYSQMGAIGKECNLEWGGDWATFPDRPHFQYTFGLSIEDLLAGKRPPEK